jgi:hypothetical protein
MPAPGLGIAAVAAQPTLLQTGNGQCPESFQTISNVSNIKWAKKTKVVDVSSHSTGDPYQRQFPTMLYTGDVTFDIFWVPEDPTHSSAQGGLTNLWKNRIEGDFQFVYPDGHNSTESFSGYVTNMGMTSAVADVLKQSITISGTGPGSWV